MKILDCESIGSTYKSLENILGIKKSRLHKLFDSVKIYDDSCSDIEPTQRLFSYVIHATHCQSDFDATYWFHCTRTWSSNTFDKGLLPLGQVIDKIWDFLFDLTKGQVTSQQWADFKHSIESSNSHGADLYRMKLANAKLHGGPHALLIREAAIEAAKSSMYWNYFEIPEIVDDIFKCCPYRIDLRHEFVTKTAPCIVKFRDDSAEIGPLRRALIYAYHKHHNLDLLPASNCCFPDEGIQIPNDGSFKVEFLPEGINSH